VLNHCFSTRSHKNRHPCDSFHIMRGTVRQVLVLAWGMLHSSCGLPKRGQSYTKVADQPLPLLRPEKAAIFDRESSDFLCALGMPSACTAAQKLFNKTKKMLLQMPASEACVPPGQVIFHHVMKTGGVSVRDYLECHCRQERCGIWRDDGHRDLDPNLDSQCPPAICTTHADYPDVLAEDRCGEKFSNAKHFTMLRNPVERVWSFYNYVRRYYKPFQERSLESILRNLGKENLNAGLKASESCKYCVDQLSNHMVRSQFCGLDTHRCQAMKHNIPDSKMLHDSLATAKRVLGNMSAIFYFDEFDQFPNNVQAVNVLPQGGFLGPWTAVLEQSLAAETCNIPQFNPTNYTASGRPARETGLSANEFGMEGPDPVTLNLIRHVNSADIRLYRYSRSLPTAITVTGRIDQLRGAVGQVMTRSLYSQGKLAPKRQAAFARSLAGRERALPTGSPDESPFEGHGRRVRPHIPPRVQRRR